jgi:SAM-dependent methyltransferase
MKSVQEVRPVFPSDIPLSDTITFLRGYLPEPPARILEVGCGDGELANRLGLTGYEVVAIDESTKAVARAQALGVNARLARWPAYQDEPFAAVLFTRSLHHIFPLDEAVAQAGKLLRPDGQVLIEDFAYEEMTAPSAEWLRQVLGLLDAAGLLKWDRGPLGIGFLHADDAVAAWHAARHHEIHQASAIEASLRRAFPRVEALTAPYLYRYACTLLTSESAGFPVGLRVLEWERQIGSHRESPLIGRRYVCGR